MGPITNIKNLKDLYKKIILKILSLFFLFFSCSKEKLVRNPYLTTPKFNLEINLNLPQFDQLRYAGGSMKINQGGLNGVLVFNINGENFVAWEATCPNHIPEECSKLEILGLLSQCKCENYKYSLANGQLINPVENQKTNYPMHYYSTLFSNNQLIISN